MFSWRYEGIYTCRENEVMTRFLGLKGGGRGWGGQGERKVGWLGATLLPGSSMPSERLRVVRVNK